MSNIPARKVMLKPDAAAFLQSIPADLKCALIDFIRHEVQHADKAMVVVSLTCDGSWPWIERAFKFYASRPTVRILYHLTHEGITIDKIAYRCDNPYGDNG